jgi:feruloyl esterase
MSNFSLMRLAVGSVLVIVCQHHPAQAQTSDASERCRAITGLHRTAVEITSALLVAAAPPGTVRYNENFPVTIPVALPAHCRIEGVINRRKGAGGVEYGIGFVLNLPDNWNGRFMFQGGGAYNGSIGEPRGFGDDPALAHGWAIIATDSGHKGAPFDTTFMRDQQAGLDFAFNAVPTVTRLGKELVTEFYGRAPDHSYSFGCSTGGREGMIGAGRYPDLFDGIVAGDPAMRVAYTRIAGWNATIAFNRIAPRDEKGDPVRRQSFPADDQKLLHAAVAKQCDRLDGLEDGLILNLAACKFDPAVLQCKSEKNADCLSAEQVAAVKAAFGGPKDGQGNPLYTGFPYDLGLLGEHPDSPMHILPSDVPGIYDLPPGTDDAARSLNRTGNPPPPFAFDFAAEIARIRTDPVEILSDTDTLTDLGTFYRRGGKIIFFNGASDPWFSHDDTLDYFKRNKKANPDFDSSRFYSIPGMAHCGGGGLERFDMLSAIVNWVEKRESPGAIVGTDLKRQTTRPLCPWPQYARYRGTGDANDVANYQCRSD